MSVETIKHTLATLSSAEQNEISAYLFHLRHASDRDYEEQVNRRLSDADSTHWMTPEEFESELDRP
jgi:hypothetical protein